MKEWYLTTPCPNLCSGYEDEAVLEYARQNFTDVLQTAFSDRVLLYSSDLSMCRKIQCVVQGNTADTPLKSLERTALFPIGTVKAGMYIFFEDRFWLITGYPGNNKSYEKAALALCQYQLQWQNASGKLVKRWCHRVPASKTDSGEAGNNVIRLSTDVFRFLLPDDEETLELDGKRVFMDKHEEQPEKVYKITRCDDISYAYGKEHGGVFCFIADKTELNIDTDNQQSGICDYQVPASIPLPAPPEEALDLMAVIEGNNKLKVRFSRTYTAIFTDRENTPVDWRLVDFVWNVVSDFDVVQKIYENKIECSVKEDSLIGESFLLQLKTRDGLLLSESQICLVKGF